MAALIPNFITGYDKGLVKNKKPFLLPNEAWETLYNGYVWRDRELKREGNQILGRLQRNLSAQSLGSTSSGMTTITITDAFTTFSLRATEPNAQFVLGTLVINIAAPDTAKFTDNGVGGFTVTGIGVAAGSYVNYITGKIVLVLSAATGGAAITAAFGYYPSLPGMGIWEKETSVINATDTIWWDTKYSYVFTSGAFDQFGPKSGLGSATWTGNDSNFFWAYNYQKSSGTSILFVTNFNYVSHTNFDPIYYTDGSTWTAFKPYLTNTGMDATSQKMFTALIVIPYYNCLLALNTWEGVADASADATNYFNRCRFSKPFADPTGADVWRTDKFGEGGSIDAPVDEEITGATFVKNTLIVDFEYSTWQLRYVGNYGIPFIWERVSADFGSGSTFSGVLFDNHRLNVGDVAITAGNSVGVNRIDLDIPDQVFAFQNEQVNNGAKRIWGVRDYKRELVFWCYPDGTDQSDPGISITYPNKVLLYNYRNNTYAIFRDNITAFGTYELQAPGFAGGAVTWDSETVTWDSETVTWDDPTPTQLQGEICIAKLNQQGYAHIFGVNTFDDPSLAITGTALSGGNILQLTIPNHNLMQFETIYLTGLEFISSSTFLPISTDLNDVIYQVYNVVDTNTIEIAIWDTALADPTYVILGTNQGNYMFTPDLSTSTYIGGGQLTLIPKMDLISKDINLYQQKGLNTKLSRIDFLLEPQPLTTSITVNLIENANSTYTTNILITSPNMSITNNADLNQTGGEYQWFPFYQTLTSQYFRIELTYDDSLMNTLTTHESDFTLYAINAWTRPGGRLIQ